MKKIKILYRTYTYRDNAIKTIIDESIRLKRNIWPEVVIRRVKYMRSIKTSKKRNTIVKKMNMGHRIYPYDIEEE